MPFTVSHTAAVLPLGRWLARQRVLAAALIGSMAPDFGLLLPFDVPRSATHGIGALFRFCLPLGLLAWVVYEQLVRPALVELLPDRWWSRCRARGAVEFGAVHTWLLAVLVVLGGAITHLVLDGFTHEGARGVEMLPVLDDFAWQVNGHPMRLYRILQHGSSVAGLLVIAAVVWHWHRRLPAVASPLSRPLATPERWGWIVAYLALPGVATLRAMRAALHGHGPELATGAGLAHIAQVAMMAGAVALLLVSLLLRLRVTARAG